MHWTTQRSCLEEYVNINIYVNIYGSKTLCHMYPHWFIFIMEPLFWSYVVIFEIRCRQARFKKYLTVRGPWTMYIPVVDWVFVFIIFELLPHLKLYFYRENISRVYRKISPFLKNNYCNYPKRIFSSSPLNTL